MDTARIEHRRRTDSLSRLLSAISGHHVAYPHRMDSSLVDKAQPCRLNGPDWVFIHQPIGQFYYWEYQHASGLHTALFHVRSDTVMQLAGNTALCVTCAVHCRIFEGRLINYRTHTQESRPDEPDLTAINAALAIYDCSINLWSDILCCLHGKVEAKMIVVQPPTLEESTITFRSRMDQWEIVGEIALGEPAPEYLLFTDGDKVTGFSEKKPVGEVNAIIAAYTAQ
jgi:hypothetical protein